MTYVSQSNNGKKLLRRHLLALLLLSLTVSAALAGQDSLPSASTGSPHGPLDIACQRCHTSPAWKPIRKNPEFDHGKTGYPLRGMHVKVPCQECHLNPVFANVGTNCQDCHADLHRRKNGAQCDICHRVYGWQVSIHSINEHQDRFPLIGAHAAVDCYSCHKAGAVGQFNRQGLSTECVSCHLTAYRKTTAPNHQAQGYSTECPECHSTMDSWRVTAFSRAKIRR
jgi:hypothetical protein